MNRSHRFCPSTTIGSDAMPIGLSISSDHASPRALMFLSVISFRD